MTIRILVNGAQGKMGTATVKAVAEDSELELVGQTGHQDNLAAEINRTKAQVVIDFTNANEVWKNTVTIIDAGAHPVIGTSGLLPEQIKELQARCAQRQLGGIIAPNFSLGAVLMMKYAQEIVKYFPQVEIIEMHHDGKLDSPSGTAMRTAEMLATARQTAPPSKKIREIVPGARGAHYQDIPVHAIRLPGLVAHQQVIFGGVGETLTLKHDSIDRVSFMPGVCFASKKVMHLKELVYGLENIL